MFTFWPEAPQPYEGGFIYPGRQREDLAGFLDHFSTENVENQQLKRYCVGNEVTPTTDKAHCHVVLQWKPQYLHSFLEMQELLNQSFGTQWGGLRYNQNPTAFIKYAKKGGDFHEWKFNPETPNRRPHRDTIAEEVIDMCKSAGMTMRMIETEHPVFCFWHHNNVVQCLSRHRAYRAGDEDGHVYQLNPEFNS